MPLLITVIGLAVELASIGFGISQDIDPRLGIKINRRYSSASMASLTFLETLTIYGLVVSSCLETFI